MKKLFFILSLFFLLLVSILADEENNTAPSKNTEEVENSIDEIIEMEEYFDDEIDDTEDVNEENNIKPISLYLGFDIGTSAIFQIFQQNPLININNVLAQADKTGFIALDMLISVNFPFGFSFDAQTETKWFQWKEGMESDDLINNLYGFPGNVSFLLKSWELSFTVASALLTTGIGKIVWEPGPAKQLKSANYFGWLFNDMEKSLLWLGFNFENMSIKAVFAPRTKWIPETFELDAFNIIPGNSILYLQWQVFLNAFDGGLFLGWDSDLTGGIWLSYAITPNIHIYGEASLTTKEWMPKLDGDSFTFKRSANNGFRAMIGTLLSPSTINHSFYLEAMYVGDSYLINDWKDLDENLSLADSLLNPSLSANLRGTAANILTYGLLNRFTFGLHIKPNTPLFEIIDYSYSLRFNTLGDFYSRLNYNLLFPGNMNLQFLWDIPFSVILKGVKTESYSFIYKHKFEILFKISIQTKNN